jgi:Membrane-associated lipoprotein involved in thiamine biosynthesis
MFRYRQRVVTAIILGFLFVCAGCADKSVRVQEFSRENIVMDTLIKITVYAADPQLGEKALNEAFAEFSRINSLADRFSEKSLPDSETSDVYQINQNAQVKPVKVSDDILAMLDRSNYFANLSEGAFDVTIGPIMDLWGFKQTEHHLPSEKEIAEKLALVGYQRIVVDKEQKTVFLPEKGMELDLGGIAKGYATDMAVQRLRELGINSAIINAGGNVYALGSKPDGSPWRVGIQDPRNNNKIIAILRVENTAVVSSGDYERYFIIDGVRYHHIIDPSTGESARQLMSTTVLASSATDADVMSTTLFVLGSERGRELLQKFTNINAVFVDPERNITFSKSLNKQIDILDQANGQVKKEDSEDASSQVE